MRIGPDAGERQVKQRLRPADVLLSTRVVAMAQDYEDGFQMQKIVR